MLSLKSKMPDRHEFRTVRQDTLSERRVGQVSGQTAHNRTGQDHMAVNVPDSH